MPLQGVSWPCRRCSRGMRWPMGSGGSWTWSAELLWGICMVAADVDPVEAAAALAMLRCARPRLT